jgi:hypothetical protein
MIIKYSISLFMLFLISGCCSHVERTGDSWRVLFSELRVAESGEDQVAALDKLNDLRLKSLKISKHNIPDITYYGMLESGELVEVRDVRFSGEIKRLIVMNRNTKIFIGDPIMLNVGDSKVIQAILKQYHLDLGRSFGFE